MMNILDAKLITAIKTPYLNSGQIDFAAYDVLMRRQVEGAVDAIVVAGTTGEGHLMDWSEQIKLIEYSVDRYGDKILIIGNTGSNSTQEAIRGTRDGFAAGMAAALQVNPYYGKTSRAGLKYHFSRVFDEGPAIVYNVPSRTAQDIDPALMRELAAHVNFIGVKECQGVERIAEYRDSHIRCWSGNDGDFFDACLNAGAQGVISVVSNIVPESMRQILLTGDVRLHEEVQSLVSWLSLEPNPIGVNTALAMLGLVSPVFRLPYFPYSIDQREEGRELLRNFFHDGGTHVVRALRDSDFILI
jgi:4-hydroxy-tetrahydrodipicolinate synthase